MKRNAKIIAVDWSLVDGQWKSLSIRQIAEKLGTTYPVVLTARKELNRQALTTGLPAESFRPEPTGRKQWDTGPADALWPTMNNRQIAQKLGIPYYAVLVKRNELIQDAIRNRQPTAPYRLQVAVPRGTDLSRADGLWSTTSNRDLAKLLGLGPTRVFSLRRGLIVRAKREGQSPAPYIYKT